MQVNIKLQKSYDWQQELIDCPQRHRMCIVSRQAGKTTTAKKIAIKELLKGKRILWVAPVHAQTLAIFRDIKETLGEIIDYVSTPKEIRLKTGGTIHFRSADNPDSLRSYNYDLIIFDEFAFANEECYKVIRPTLSATKGKLLIISTPCGMNHMWDLKEKVKDNPDWYITQRDYTCSPHLTEEEMDKARKEMTEGEFRQEHLAEFISPKNAIFRPEWLQNLFVKELPPLNECQRKMIACDISLGTSFKSDFQAIVCVFFHNNIFYVDAYAERMPIIILSTRIKQLYDYYKPEGIAIETNGYQILVKNDLERLFAVPPIIFGIDNRINKTTRISRLSTILRDGRLKILENKGGLELFKELSDFGSKDCVHDDVADALEMAIRALIHNQ